MHAPDFNSVSVPQLETPRLLLRQATTGDLDDWATRIFADPDVTRFLPKSDLSPRQRAERMRQRFDANWAQFSYGVWLVTDKGDGLVIGHCGLGYLPETGEVEVDYALAKGYWGRGLATEAVHASLWFGFEHVALERIIGLVLPANIASRRVLEHNGFAYEKDAHYFGLEVAYYGINQDQFRGDGSVYRLC